MHTRVTSAGYNIAGFTSPALTLDPGQSGQTGAQFFAGPKDQYRLKEISPYLDLSVDYGWLACIVRNFSLPEKSPRSFTSSRYPPCCVSMLAGR